MRAAASRGYAVTKLAPSTPELQHLFERAVEHGVARAVVEVGDQHGHRRLLLRPACTPWRPRNHDPDAAATISRTATAQHPVRARLDRHRDRLRIAVLVERVERLAQFVRGLVARLGIGLQAPRDQRVHGSGTAGIHRPRRRQRLGQALLEVGERIARLRARGAAEDDVVEDQPERVDVRALIDRLPGGLLGRHVVERAHHAAGDGQRARHLVHAGRARRMPVCPCVPSVPVPARPAPGRRRQDR